MTCYLRTGARKLGFLCRSLPSSRILLLWTSISQGITLSAWLWWQAQRLLEKIEQIVSRGLASQNVPKISAYKTCTLKFFIQVTVSGIDMCFGGRRDRYGPDRGYGQNSSPCAMKRKRSPIGTASVAAQSITKVHTFDHISFTVFLAWLNGYLLEYRGRSSEWQKSHGNYLHYLHWCYSFQSHDLGKRFTWCIAAECSYLLAIEGRLCLFHKCHCKPVCNIQNCWWLSMSVSYSWMVFW